jgi:tetratricopeptide (TPR) repeat protein
MPYRISMAPFLALLFVTHLMVAQQASNRLGVDELMRAGVAAQQQGDYRSAIASFQNALTIDPDIVEARERLGQSLAADGQLDAAIEQDRRLLATSPDRPGVRLSLALALYQKNDLEHARAELETLLAANPGDLPAAKLMANTYIKLGRESEAIELLMPLEPGRDADMELEY